MIRGSKEVKIKEYLMIDRMEEGLGFTKPKDGEEILGIPYGYDTETSTPYIEHRVSGKVVESVNCADVSIIVFDNDGADNERSNKDRGTGRAVQQVRESALHQRSA